MLFSARKVLIIGAVYGSAVLAAAFSPVARAQDAGLQLDAQLQNEPALLNEIGCGAELTEAGVSPLPKTATDDGRLDVLIVGSSSTAGVGAGGADRSYPAQSARLLKARAAELGLKFGFRVTPRGVSGERAAGALARLAKEIDETEPDLLVWQVGTNDAVGRVPLDQLEQTVLSGVEMARERGLGVVLVDPQFYPKISSNSDYAAVVTLIDSLAERLKAPLVRRFDRMRRALDMGDEQKLAQLLAKDRFHMSPLGHECLARDLVATILPIIRTAQIEG